VTPLEISHFPHAVQQILAQLEDVVQVGPDQWKARCPAHQDDTPSLYVAVRNGRVLLHDFGGCSTQEVLDALGLEWSDLFLDDNSGPKTPYRKKETQYFIRNLQGEVIAIHVRIDQPDGAKTFYWLRDGRKGLGGLKAAELPLYGTEHLPALPDDATVVVVEGEKAADALWERGIPAVATVCGANVVPSEEVLEPLVRLDPVLWPDNDPQGREHMQRIGRILRRLGGRPRWLEWREAPKKGDAADFTDSPDEIRTLVAAAKPWEPLWPNLLAAPALLVLQLPDPVWIVPGLIPAGLSLLAGKPKIGKSWFVLGISLAVAYGGRALGTIPVQGGKVLYLALEDSARRLQSRLQMLIDGSPPESLMLAMQWPRLAEGGLERINEFVADHPETRLLVVDTLAKVRNREGKSSRLYDEDYASIEGLQILAHEREIGIIVVHHLRKSESDDPLDLVSGTTGLTAAADTVLILRRPRGRADAELFLTGRDLEEREFALQFDTRIGWRLLGDAREWRLTKERHQIVETIRYLGGEASPKEIAEALGAPPGNVRQLLRKLHRDGFLRRTDRGRYSLSGHFNNNSSLGSTDNGDNFDNIDTAPLPVPSAPDNARGPSPNQKSERPVTDVIVDTSCASCGHPIRAGEANEHGRCPHCAAEDLVPW